jgi:hypothetical protein
LSALQGIARNVLAQLFANPLHDGRGLRSSSNCNTQPNRKQFTTKNKTKTKPRSSKSHTNLMVALVHTRLRQLMSAPQSCSARARNIFTFLPAANLNGGEGKKVDKVFYGNIDREGGYQMRVGYASTSNLVAIFSDCSASTLAMMTRSPLSCRAAASSFGASCLQGPHLTMMMREGRASEQGVNREICERLCGTRWQKSLRGPEEQQKLWGGRSCW